MNLLEQNLIKLYTDPLELAYEYFDTIRLAHTFYVAKRSMATSDPSYWYDYF